MTHIVMYIAWTTKDTKTHMLSTMVLIGYMAQEDEALMGKP